MYVDSAVRSTLIFPPATGKFFNIFFAKLTAPLVQSSSRASLEDAKLLRTLRKEAVTLTIMNERERSYVRCTCSEDECIFVGCEQHRLAEFMHFLAKKVFLVLLVVQGNLGEEMCDEDGDVMLVSSCEIARLSSQHCIAE